MTTVEAMGLLGIFYFACIIAFGIFILFKDIKERRRKP